MTQPPAIRISDHALVRFLERAGGYEVEALRAAIGASLKRALNAADKMGAEDFTIAADGLLYVVRSGVCTTILFDGPRHG